MDVGKNQRPILRPILAPSVRARRDLQAHALENPFEWRPGDEPSSSFSAIGLFRRFAVPMCCCNTFRTASKQSSSFCLIIAGNTGRVFAVSSRFGHTSHCDHFPKLLLFFDSPLPMCILRSYKSDFVRKLSQLGRFDYVLNAFRVATTGSLEDCILKKKRSHFKSFHNLIPRLVIILRFHSIRLYVRNAFSLSTMFRRSSEPPQRVM